MLTDLDCIILSPGPGRPDNPAVSLQTTSIGYNHLHRTHNHLIRSYIHLSLFFVGRIDEIGYRFRPRSDPDHKVTVVRYLFGYASDRCGLWWQGESGFLLVLLLLTSIVLILFLGSSYYGSSDDS